MTSSHAPSTLVNIAFVSFGRPLERTRRTASATAPDTESPTPSGVIEKASSIAGTPHPQPAGSPRRSGGPGQRKGRGTLPVAVGGQQGTVEAGLAATPPAIVSDSTHPPPGTAR